MKTKVKVKRAELLKIVDGRLRKAEREHERAVAAYPKRVEEYNTKVVATLEKALAKARDGKSPTDRYGRLELGGSPQKPSENGRELCNLRRLKRTLEIGADATILLSQEDADDYFGPCAL
jgi:hypothetical protein